MSTKANLQDQPTTLRSGKALQIVPKQVVVAESGSQIVSEPEVPVSDETEDIMSELLLVQRFIGKEQNVERWLETFLNDYATTKGLEQERKIATYKLLLSETARDWFDELDEQTKGDFQSIQEAMIDHFRSKQSWSVTTNVFKRMKRKNGTMKDYRQHQSYDLAVES